MKCTYTETTWKKIMESKTINILKIKIQRTTTREEIINKILHYKTKRKQQNGLEPSLSTTTLNVNKFYFSIKKTHRFLKRIID